MQGKLISIIALAAAAITLPVAAQAKVTRAELRHDVRDVRQERHDVARAVHAHNPAQVKAERHELRGAKHELREDSRAFVRQHRGN